MKLTTTALALVLVGASAPAFAQANPNNCIARSSVVRGLAVASHSRARSICAAGSLPYT